MPDESLNGETTFKPTHISALISLCQLSQDQLSALLHSFFLGLGDVAKN